MSLRSVRLENFRGFKDAEIVIRPLTVLVGANSSGKSSFSQALAVLSHAQRLYSTSPQLTLSPEGDPHSWPADFGSLQDVRRSGAKGPICVSVGTDEGPITWGFGLDQGESQDTRLDISYIRLPGEINNQQPIVQESTFSPVAASGSFSFGAKLQTAAGSLQAYRKINRVQWRDELSDVPSSVTFRGLALQSASHESGTNVVPNYPVAREIESIFGELTYLRAVRNRPVRSYGSRFQTGQPIVGYAGEGFASLLHSRGDDLLDGYLPPVEKKVNRKDHSFLTSSWEKGSQTLLEAVRQWLRHLRLAADVDACPHPRNPDFVQIRITLPSGTPHDISEVGFGLSQVLPVLVAGLLQPRSGPFIVDLPEAHLHPKPQALIADFFCALALEDKRCLVETHSEMFVNQLRLRAAMDKRVLDNTAVYFFDEPDNGDCQKPRLIGLDQLAQLEWPIGFLEEAWAVESKINDIRLAEREEK